MRIGSPWSRLAASFVVWAVSVAWTLPCAAEQHDLLSIVQAGHRSSCQSIRSLSASVHSEITFVNQPKLVLNGHYWRSLDVIRLQERNGPGTDDVLLKDSEIRQVGRGPGSEHGRIEYGAARRAKGEPLGLLDVWDRIMLSFAGPNGERCDLDGFIAFAKRSPQTKRERKDGHDCIRLTMTTISRAGVEHDDTLWHDIDRNYLVWKMRVTDKSSPGHVECEILEFAEPSPGVFVPVKCRREAFNGNSSQSLEEVTLTDLRVNEKIPESVFQLPAIPPGTILSDRIQGAKYPIDATWRQIGPSEPLASFALPSNTESKVTEFHAQSTTEARPLTHLLASASLALLIVACACLLYRRLRGRRRLHASH